MTPAGYGRRNAILAMIGIVYHPLLILLAPVVIESLGLYSPMLLPLALGAFLILPFIAAIVVHASSGIRDRFRLSARLTFSLGMIWLPMAAGWFVLTLSQC